MEIMIMIPLLCSVIFTTILFFQKQTPRKKSTPPSPPRLPLIGNLYQLGNYPHRSLWSLSQHYGPLMLLHFGRVPVLVVSSSDAARQCRVEHGSAARDVLKKYDRIFDSRPQNKILEKLLYDGHDVASAPYGEHWRQMRSVSVIHLLSNKMVQSFRNIRDEEIRTMMGKIRQSSSLPVNLSKLLASFTNDVICRVALGKKYGDDTDFKELINSLTGLLGLFSVGSYIPWLAWIDWICGLDNQVEKTRNNFDEFLERVVQDHEDGDGDGTDFVDVLLTIQREKSMGFEIERRSIKGMILDVFVGGTDTTSVLMEWAMTELLSHPTCLKRLQEEVRLICKGRSSVSEDDVQDMNYLKAVTKETLRLHPPLPLLAPHLSTQDVRLGDYHIPAGTQVMINAFAVGREVASWGPDVELFRPERHLDSSVDFRGQDFHLIPFGAGRRICPGISFAALLNEVALANLMLGFDWQSTEDQTDVAESTGSVIHRMFPLYAIAS